MPTSQPVGTCGHNVHAQWSHCERDTVIANVHEAIYHEHLRIHYAHHEHEQHSLRVAFAFPRASAFDTITITFPTSIVAIDIERHVPEISNNSIEATHPCAYYRSRWNVEDFSIVSDSATVRSNLFRPRPHAERISGRPTSMLSASSTDSDCVDLVLPNDPASTGEMQFVVPKPPSGRSETRDPHERIISSGK
jgi:hypothetical protein